MSVSSLERYFFRKERVRRKIFGTKTRPRLSIYRSLNHIYAQIIDDSVGKTLVASSSLDASIKKELKAGSNCKAAQMVGQSIAQKAVKLEIKKVVFDRGGRLFHGRVKALADGARLGGLEF